MFKPIPQNISRLICLDHSLALIRSFILPKWLGGRVAGFTASGSLKDDLNERRANYRAPLLDRLRHILFDCGAIFHLVYIISCLLSMSKYIRQTYIAAGNDTYRFWMAILPVVAWPPPVWYQMVIACLTPLQYACFPPDVPDREDCLDRDPASGVAYPTDKAKLPTWTMRGFRYVQLHFLIIIYASVVLAFTWKL